MKKMFALLSCFVLFTGSAEAVTHTVITNTPFKSYATNNAYRYKNSHRVYNNGRYNQYNHNPNYHNSHCNDYNRQYNNNRQYYNNNPYYDIYNQGYNNRPLRTIINRIKGDKETKNKNEVNISYQGYKEAPMSYPKISEAEKTILGRTYESQDLDSRLDRLEHSVFKKTYPKMSYEQRVNNLLKNYSNNNQNMNNSMLDLSKIEQGVFKRSFDMDDPQKRIERIEERMFGAAQSGDINKRYETLKRASKNYSRNNSAYNRAPMYSDSGLPYYTPIISGSSGGWRSLFSPMMGQTLMGGMGGVPTGMTPQMSPSYMDYMDAQSAGGEGSFNRYRNGGYDYDNRSTGGRTGVTILD